MSRSPRRSSGSGTDIPPHDFVGRGPPEGWWRGNCTEVGRFAGDLLKLAPLTPPPCSAWSPSPAEAGEELGRSAGHRVEHVLADPAIELIGVEETEQDRRQDQGASTRAPAPEMGRCAVGMAGQHIMPLFLAGAAA